MRYFPFQKRPHTQWTSCCFMLQSGMYFNHASSFLDLYCGSQAHLRRLFFLRTVSDDRYEFTNSMKLFYILILHLWRSPNINSAYPSRTMPRNWDQFTLIFLPPLSTNIQPKLSQLWKYLSSPLYLLLFNPVALSFPWTLAKIPDLLCFQNPQTIASEKNSNIFLR